MELIKELEPMVIYIVKMECQANTLSITRLILEWECSPNSNRELQTPLPQALGFLVGKAERAIPQLAQIIVCQFLIILRFKKKKKKRCL